uniref:Ceramide synthase 2-like n=1 Tax=Stegastes partitus TaxID=144197 RepID=A0A3B5AF80_9TELE
MTKTVWPHVTISSCQQQSERSGCCSLDGTVSGSHRPLGWFPGLLWRINVPFLSRLFRLVALPLSRVLGVKDRIRIRAPSIPKLEAFYKQNNRQPSQSEVVSLGKQCGLSQRKIQTWFRHRRNQDRPSNTRKFCETPWFWDHRECWRGYPKQPVAEAHYWYYVLEMGFYLSLLLCVSVDVKRKDFKEQVIHHIATLFLIGFSYCANYVRVGTLVMLVHDSSDFLLESAKMFHYAVWTRTCDSLFVVFALVFLVTRLVVFPGRVVHTTLVVSLEFFQPFFGYYFFNALLLVLQALHIFWAYLILRMVYKFVFLGKVERDERSDEESDDDEEEPEDDGDECSWEQRKGAINSKLASLANNCVLNNLTNQRSMNSRLPKAR